MPAAYRPGPEPSALCTHPPRQRPTETAGTGASDESRKSENQLDFGKFIQLTPPTFPSTGYMSTDDTSKPKLSRVLCASAAVIFGIGLISGVSTALTGDTESVTHLPDTNAWGVHLVLTGLTLAMILATWVVRRRTGRASTPLILAPIGARAARRLRRTARVAPLRMVPIVLLLAFTAYGLWRAGVQVFAGLDPGFVVNAWGGPSYLGAMYCHYLDIGLMITAALIVIHLLLVPSERDQ